MQQKPLTGDGHILHAIKVSADELQNNMLDPMRMRNTFKLGELNTLSKYLKTDLRETALFVAIYVCCYNDGDPELKDIAEFFGCTPFDMLSYHKQLESLIDKGIVIETLDSSVDDSSAVAFCNSTFQISAAVSYDILTDKPLNLSANEENYDIYDFLREADELKGPHTSSKELCEKIEKLEEKHQLESLVNLKTMVPCTIDRCLLYSITRSQVDDIFIDDNYMALRPILKFLYDTDSERVHTFMRIKQGMHPLVENRLISLTTGSYSTAKVRLTRKGRTMMLVEDADAFVEKEEREVFTIGPDRIKQKVLFFDGKTDEAYRSLINGLNEDNFKKIQKKLSASNMPNGLTAIFYGSPGTGKTEMAYQIAKATGRSIIPVDISETKSMWFGESEHRIRDVFKNYRRACSYGKLKPVLLFNEADGVLTKRMNMDRGTACTQTENAIQNIILEEMEKFNGILIATTNLETNLDKAFERRFLYKVKFEKPSETVKAKIWKSKLPSLTDENAMTLARNYDFSGGEIDNIVRKAITREITECLDETSFDDIVEFCESERFEKNNMRTPVGFRA